MANRSPTEDRVRDAAAAIPAKPLIGWIGLDVPVEVLAAAGTPVRIDADPAFPPGAAAGFGEGGGHPWMRAVADRVLALASTLDRVVIGSTPATGVWLYNFFLTLARGPGAPRLPAFELVNISHEPRPSAAALNRASVASLIDRLGVRHDALLDAIDQRNRIRDLQRRVDVLRYGERPRFTGSKARLLLDAADQLNLDAYAALVQQALEDTPSAPSQDLAPVIYSGPGSPSLDVYAALEVHGLSVVGDDADFGTRAIGPDVDASADPIEAIARRYQIRSPAPAGWSIRQRTDWLVELARTRGARAVIFDLPAWAHPPAWDFPTERRALQALGVDCIIAPQAPAAEAAQAAADALRASPGETGAHV